MNIYKVMVINAFGMQQTLTTQADTEAKATQNIEAIHGRRAIDVQKV